MDNEDIVLKGKSFTFVKSRHLLPVSVYKGEDSYLRVGPKEILGPELELHRNLLRYGFPVPEIIEHGELNNEFYYLEASLGENHFGEIFREDCMEHGKISDENFSRFLEISKKFAKAQLKTELEPNEEGFYIGIHVDSILEELPDIKDDIVRAFKKAVQNTRDLPWVLTHGDFNPFNIFTKGVIDFGSSFHAPAGYDIISCMYHTQNFPVAGDYEVNVTRRYDFSEEQVKNYLVEMDRIYADAKAPMPTRFIEDVKICRMIWSAARIHKYPKLQKWRYDRLRNMVGDYLKGGATIDGAIDPSKSEAV
jgi:hypothetical protein